MIKGIQIRGGALFVEWDGFSTYRYTKGSGWTVSPVLYFVVEHDMQTEGPDAFEYLTAGEIRARDDFDVLRALHKQTCEICGFVFEDEEVVGQEAGVEDAPVTLEELLSCLDSKEEEKDE